VHGRGAAVKHGDRSLPQAPDDGWASLPPCGAIRGVGGESGQAVVEAAIVLPLCLVLILCTIQIAQLQQARVLLEYAAFPARRGCRARPRSCQGGKLDRGGGSKATEAALSVLPAGDERRDKRSSVAWPSSRFIVLSLAERGGSGLHSAAQGTARRADPDRRCRRRGPLAG
jgi:TadE-like protein